MGVAGFGGSFAPIVQYEKWEIHPVFPHFPYFRSGQNLSPNLLAPLCGVAFCFVRFNDALHFGTDFSLLRLNVYDKCISVKKKRTAKEVV